MGEQNYGWWFPPNLGGTTAREVDNLIDYMHWLMLALFIGWAAFYAYTLWRFRARAGHRATYELGKAKASKPIEIAVVVAELVLLFGFSMPVWAKVKDQVPTEADAVVVRCVAEQFAWNFQYPGKDGRFGRSDPALMSQANPMGLSPTDDDAKDDIVTLNALHMPVNQKMVVRGTSKDVIHGFSLPVLRAKQDLIPGMSVPIWFEAKHDSKALRQSLTRSVSIEGDPARLALRLGSFVAMEEYKDKDGKAILRSAAGLEETGVEGVIGFTQMSIQKLLDAGIKEVKAAPRNPEVACAQLCGNLHYRMRGSLSIHSESDFAQWLEKTPKFGEAGGDEEEEEEEE